MNKIIMALGLCVSMAFVSTTTWAATSSVDEALDTGRITVGVNIGHPVWPGTYAGVSSPSFGWSVRGGYLVHLDFDVVAFEVGAEAGYADLGKKSTSTYSTSNSALFVGGRAIYYFAQPWSATARLGVYHGSYKYDTKYYHYSNNTNDIYVGVGIGYSVTQKILLGANYTSYRGNGGFGMFSLSGEYHF